MIIEYGNIKSMDIAKNIWMKSFDDDEDTINFYFNNIFNENNFLNLKLDGEVISSLHENKYIVTFNNQTFETFYIVGVATDITKRKKGYMSKLLNFSITNSYKKNLPFIFLSAIDSSIYRKFGFEYFSSIETYSLDISQLNELDENKNLTFKEIELNSLDNFLEDLINVYDSCMKDIFINLKRDKFYFKKLLMECFNDKMRILVSYENGKMNGYIIYGINSKTIEVREVFAINTSIKSSLIKLLLTHKDYCNHLIINSVISSNIDFLFKNQVKIKKELSHFMMARLINVKKIFQLLNVKESIRICVVDNIIPENNGIFDLSNENIQVANNNDYDIKINVEDLTLLALGYMSVNELIQLKNINISDAILNRLNKIFFKQNNYLYEFM